MLPLTISAQDGLISQYDYFDKKIASINLTTYYILKNGEFAYNKSYSNGYPYGAIKRLDSFEEGALSSLYICFCVSNIDSNYLCYYFDSNKWNYEVKIISGEGARNHGLLNLTPSDFFNIRIFKPHTLEEQCKISNFLELIYAKEKIINRKINILKKYKEGILFKYKKEANKNGKILKLASICSLISGYNFNTNDYIINGNFDIVTIRNVMDDRYIDGDYKHVNFIPKSYVKLSKGDLLISMTGNVGRCSYVNDNNKLLNQRLCKFECEDTNKKFIYMITKTNSFKKRMNILAQGGAQPNLKNNDILNYIFFKIEDKLIHKNYVEAFDKTDQLLEQSKCLTKTLKRLKRILLNQLFI